MKKDNRKKFTNLASVNTKLLPSNREIRIYCAQPPCFTTQKKKQSKRNLADFSKGSHIKHFQAASYAPIRKVR